ncbi:hypothetical protein [Bordetella avium]|uniref:hypothetical protein n=1 Tax=Bordetella avium TaxID=521 RepID=UPI000FD957EA|nr:hypothetical protein [Bordetella avium]AZY52173.1 hypothetical protein C0J07_06365 [Bordetella avium]
MSKRPHPELNTSSDAEQRAQRTLAAANRMMNREATKIATEISSAEAELMHYMEELRTRQRSGYGHAGVVLQRRPRLR